MSEIKPQTSPTGTDMTIYDSLVVPSVIVQPCQAVSKASQLVLSLANAASGNLTWVDGSELVVPSNKEWLIKLTLLGVPLSGDPNAAVMWSGLIFAYHLSGVLTANFQGATEFNLGPGQNIAVSVVDTNKLRFSVNSGSSGGSGVNCNWTALLEILSATNAS